MANILSISGDKELYEEIKALAGKFAPSKIENIIEKAADIITKQAKENAPVGVTGNLKKGIVTKKWISKGYQTIYLSAVDYKISPHAHLVEYGHRLIIKGQKRGKVKAYPFFRPAVDAKRNEALRIIEDGAIRIIEEVGR